jgi:hypothetical protein
VRKHEADVGVYEMRGIRRFPPSPSLQLSVPHTRRYPDLSAMPALSELPNLSDVPLDPFAYLGEIFLLADYRTVLSGAFLEWVVDMDTVCTSKHHS